MPINYPDDHVNNYDETKNYREMVFRNRKAFTGNDANNFQSMLIKRSNDIANGIFQDGDLKEGGTPSVVSGNVIIAAGTIFIAGECYDFDEVTGLVIATDKEVELGVYLDENVIDNNQDTTLVDPSVGLETSNQPTQYRVQKTITWGWKNTDGSADSGDVGVFYPVHLVINGTLVIRDEAPGLGQVQEAIAGYDRDSTGGFYVIEGLEVEFESEDATDYLYSIKQGKARVNGFPVKRPTGEEFSFTQDPDLQLVQNETQTQSVSGGEATISPNNIPLESVTNVAARLEITESIGRGLVADTADDVSEDGVYEIVSVSQGATTYNQGADYQLTDGKVDWAPGGAEPSGGTTYDVTYRFVKNIPIKAGSLTDTEFVIEDQGSATLLDNQQCLINYNYKLKRIDQLELTEFGSLDRQKGVSRAVDPQVPNSTPGNLPLALIFYDWINDPVIDLIAPTRVKVGDQNRMQEQITSNTLVIAELAQAAQINSLDNSVKAGMFVDTFVDNSQRDFGLVQNLETSGGMLCLPITADDYLPTEASKNNENTQSLPYNLVETLVQDKETGQVKINPYDSFTPIPKPIVITPKVDNNINQFTAPFISRGPVPPQVPVTPPSGPVVAPSVPEPSILIARGKRTTITPPPSSWDQAFEQAKAYHQANRTNPNKKSTNRIQKRKIRNLAASLLAGENVTGIRINRKPVTVNQT
jgi:hypothetical protein